MTQNLPTRNRKTNMIHAVTRTKVAGSMEQYLSVCHAHAGLLKQLRDELYCQHAPGRR